MRTILFDADLLAYRTAAAFQDTIDWNGDGSCVSIDGKLEEAKRYVRDEIDSMMEDLKGDELIVCLSDEVINFRSQIIDPTYKQNRSGTERPIHLYDLKDWIAETYPCRGMTRLEADDVQGIMATEPHKGDRIMVSADKDMKTIPGLLCNPMKDRKKVVSSSLEEADRFHLWQTLCGDSVDGYPGCPGTGPGAAEDLLNGLGWESYDHELKSGKRKGEVETRWRRVEMPQWDAIVSAYERVGQTVENALTQARLAFILRHGYVDGSRIKMWEPTQNR